MTTWNPTAHHTGRNRLAINLAGTGTLRGQTLRLARTVPDAAAWMLTRFQVSVFLLRDTGGLTEDEARRATLVALTYMSRNTADGLNEYDGNAGCLLCVDGVTAVCVRIAGFPLEHQRNRAAFNGVVTGTRAFWNAMNAGSGAPARWTAFKRGDLSAIAAMAATGDVPMVGDTLSTQLDHVQALLGAVARGTVPTVPLTPTPRTPTTPSTPRTPGSTPATPDETGEPSDDGGDGGMDEYPPEAPPRRRKKRAGVVLALAALVAAVVAR